MWESRALLGGLRQLCLKSMHSIWQRLFFILKPSTSKCNGAIEEVIVKKTINHMQHQVRNSTTLAIHSSGVGSMQEHFKKSTNFGQSGIYPLNEVVLEVISVLGVLGHNLSRSYCFHVRLVTCCDLSTFLYYIEVFSINSSKLVGNFLEVYNFNWLSLKLNRLICN